MLFWSKLWACDEPSLLWEWSVDRMVCGESKKNMKPAPPIAFTNAVWMTAVFWLALLAGSIAQTKGVPELLSEEFTISRYGREEGMPELAVQAIGQSADGFIWCLTSNYFLRFDGVGFRPYGGMDGDAVQKPYPILFNGWLADGGGGAWVFGRRGAARRTESGWRRLDGGEAWRPMIAMMPAAAGFHAVTAEGVWRVEGDRWAEGPKELKPPKGMRIACAVADGKGGILLGGNLGVHRFDGAEYVSLADPAETGAVSRMVRGDGNEWWACGTGGLSHGAAGGVVLSETPFPGEQATAMMVDGGVVWVGTKTGLFRMRDGNWSRLTSKEVAASLEVISLHQDRENHIWVGTADGLLCLRRKWVDVLVSRTREGKLPVSSLAADAQGSLWAGSVAEGLMRVSDEELSLTELPGLPEGVGVSSLAPAAGGGLWVGTLGGGLMHRAPNGALRSFSERAGSAKQADEVSALWAAERMLWVGTRRGLFTLEFPARTGEAVFLDPVLMKTDTAQLSVFSNRVSTLTEYGGTGVLAGYDGLWAVRHDAEPEKGGFGYGWGLSPNVRVFFRDSGGRLWAGASDGLGLLAEESWIRVMRESGLFVEDSAERGRARREWQRQGKRMLWQKLDATHGLANTDVRQIGEDLQGRLWLGTRKGIQIFSRDDLLDVGDGRKTSAEGRLISIEEGMASEECTLNSSPGAIVDAVGNLHFATTDGVVRVDPTRILTPERPPSVFIEQVVAGERTIYERAEISPLTGSPVSPPQDRETILSSGSGDISFGFASPSYDAPSRMQFRWRLDGLDSDWSQPSSEWEVAYPRLRHGVYTFRVMAGGQGAWREAVAPFRFRIQPRWFELPGVQALAGIAAAGLIAIGIRRWERRRTFKRIDRLKRESALERERARISRDLHDEMGVGLTEIGLLGDLVALPASEKTGELAAEISQRARGLVGSLDEIVWAINPANDHSLALGDYFSRYAENLLQRAGIRCRLDVENHSLDAPIDAEGRHNLFLAFKEALNNVINHAGASEVRIRIAEDGSVLAVRVEDDGCGFTSPKGEGSPDGLRGLRDRLAAIGGSCDIRSVPGEGTSITFTLPVRKS
jgi:signal transduction histidine kinase/ligand-binding sensor domain-containing protein